MKKIQLLLFGKTYEILSKSKKLNDINVLNILKRVLPRRNIYIDDIIKNNIDNVKKCRNCNNDAKYNFKYNIKYDNDNINIEIYGIEYPKIDKYEKLYCGKCLKEYNANSKIYISKICGVNQEIANELILKRNKSPFYRHNHSSDEEYKESQTRNKDWYIKKYGKEEGEKKFNNVIKKMVLGSNKEEHRYKKDSQSLNFFKNKNKNKQDAIKEYKQNCKLIGYRNTINYYVEKYGKEEGEKRYFDKIEKIKYSNTVEYYIEKYGKEEGEKRYNSWKQKCTLSLNRFIEKYGKEEGEKRYKKWLIGVCKAFGNFYSKESKLFFDRLKSFFPDLTIYYAENERFIYDKNGYNNQHIFFYDAYIKEFNLIIEYDTPAYHPNLTYLTEEEIQNNKVIHREYDFNKDIFKENLAKQKGYKFYRVFIKDKTEKIKELKKLINFIRNDC